MGAQGEFFPFVKHSFDCKMRTTAVLLIACLVCFVTSDFAADHEAALPENGFTEDATELIAIKAASRTLKNIVALKAYSVAARPKVQQLKLTTSASHSGNAILWDFVLEFGKRAPKPVKPAVVPLSQFGFGFATKKTKKSSMKSNIVMQYSQAMGKLKGKYGKGLGRYLLNHLDEAVMSSKNGAVVFYSGRTSAYAQSRPVMMFSYKALALTHMPKYLLKMAVRLSKFSILQLDIAKASKNAAAKASAMWLHTGKNKHYRDFISKTITKYRKVEKANAEKVFKAALHGARKAFKKNSKHVHPMVPGARAGANAAATKSSFKFPSTKKIKAEARAAADKWAKKMKNIKPSGLVKYLEKKAQAAEKKATKKKATKKKATKKKATKTKKKATKKKATKKKATK